jgi:signal-induced proliferation-associated 1 like protein 3
MKVCVLASGRVPPPSQRLGGPASGAPPLALPLLLARPLLLPLAPLPLLLPLLPPALPPVLLLVPPLPPVLPPLVLPEPPLLPLALLPLVLVPKPPLPPLPLLPLPLPLVPLAPPPLLLLEPGGYAVLPAHATPEHAPPTNKKTGPRLTGTRNVVRLISHASLSEPATRAMRIEVQIGYCPKDSPPLFLKAIYGGHVHERPPTARASAAPGSPSLARCVNRCAGRSRCARRRGRYVFLEGIAQCSTPPIPRAHESSHSFSGRDAND